jgi:hypothetical protein
MIANRTHIFVIGENDWSEKTGNVSFFVEISAFNQNYSVYESMSQNTKSQDWRWRRSEHRFNLTILLEPAYEVAWRLSRIFCFNGWEWTLTARKNCETVFSKNITIDHLGYITLELGDYFSFPDNFEKLIEDGESEFKSFCNISLAANPYHKLNYTIEMVSYTASIGIKRGKKIEEKSIKELVGATVEEFKQAYVHEFQKEMV